VTPGELNQIAEKERQRQAGFKRRVHVCVGSSCLSLGSDKILGDLRERVEGKGLQEQVEVTPCGCLGTCSRGPLAAVRPENTIYQYLDSSRLESVVEKHLAEGKPVDFLTLFSDDEGFKPGESRPHPYFQKQTKVVLENCGSIDPLHCEGCLAAGGYQALVKALTLMSPGEVIGEVKQSGLRGRGGAGYPTGLKWEMVHQYAGDEKYVVCNGDEGDPGAFMDRSVLEGDPHRVLEGMIVGGYAVGAGKGFAYIRGEYPLAIERFETAIKEARKKGLLGKDILGSGFSFDVEVRVGGGAFVCGEETALLASIEGKRGTPHPRPPYPAEKGLWGKPTLINNVETFANIAPIIEKGGQWYSSLGMPKSPGTKVFALSGRVRNTGLVEVPVGITLREVIFDIGGGIPGGKKFKAAQTGGPSGGCIPEQHLDTPLDYESLVALGSIMGSGGLIVMDETACMVDVARFFMEFCVDESCGKCLPCRVGTRQLHGMLLKIGRGGATMEDLELMEELAEMVRETSLCGLGIWAPSPLKSTLRYFRDEYLAHIVEKRCPAGVCAMAGKAVNR
jgi:NADH:ubiquinone oxidoreductase subunit F (NADH-binding)/(2Fe-2S) ferredoxin